jgi:hypothetical protein
VVLHYTAESAVCAACDYQGCGGWAGWLAHLEWCWCDICREWLQHLAAAHTPSLTTGLQCMWSCGLCASCWPAKCDHLFAYKVHEQAA